jgi:hypothetical protein
MQGLTIVNVGPITPKLFCTFLLFGGLPLSCHIGAPGFGQSNK